MHLTVTVNSPGEVSGWLLPLVDELKCADISGHVTAVLTPCAFAGGLERTVLERTTGIDEVTALGPHLRALVRDRWLSRRTAPPGRHIVLHLGGDRVYSLLIARLRGAPAWAYGTSSARWRSFAHLLVPDARTRSKLLARGVPADRISIVGQLVVDSVPAAGDSLGLDPTLGLDPAHDDIVSLLAGSRPYELDFMLPFYAAVVDELAERMPRVRCVLPWSGFVPRADIERALAGSGAAWRESAGTATLVTPAGVSVPVIEKDRYAAMRASRMAVSLPGTITLQLAALGVPTIVAVPLNRAETIVVEGPLNWLSPRWGPSRALKRALLFRLNDRLKYVALPNIIADEAIVPELRVEMTPHDLSEAIVRLLGDEDARARMSARLVEAAGPRGAARAAAALLIGPDAPRRA
ncbi:MAG: hypothetical protein AB1806_02630 [Acidobacteriota bacterium]